MIRKIWKYYKRYIKIANLETKLALIFGLLGALLETVSIYLLANLITNIDNEKINLDIFTLDSIYFSKITYIYFFIFFALNASFLYFLSNKNIVKAKSKVERFIRSEITDLTLDIKWEFYLKMSQGDISKSILSEGQNISEGYLYFISALTYSLISFTYFFISLVLVPDTFLILVLYGFFAYRVYVFFSRKAEIFGKDLSFITSKIGKWTSSIFNNLKYIRTISRENIAKEESKIIFRKFSKSYENAMIASYKSKLVTELLTIAFIFVAIIYISIKGSSTSNLILSLSLFIRMTPKIYNTQSRFLDSVAMLSWPKTHYEKVKWARNHSEKKSSKSLENIDKCSSIKFKSVSFSYPNNKLILENLNLDIKAKDSIGILGKSGSGKSTLLDLITGILKPLKGEIFISGKNISNINLSSWRSNIGIVMQDNFFKNDTIFENIALGQEIIDKRKINNCLELANALEFVEKLPNGINEIMFDRGMRLSGGERQKIALARALYSNPQILIMDEPTNGLDKNSEKEFIYTIKKLIGEIIIIIISHKPEVVNLCERVLILENKKLNNYLC